MKATGHISAERFYGDFVKIDNSRWRVYHPTGHVDITSQGVQTWMYYVRDRLGSTRAVITEQGVPLQATDYYPSGIPVETYSTGNAYNTTDRLHTGKEFHAFDGLSWHDNSARFHDTLFPRFTTVDPLAEKDPGTSPYAYCGNNPLRFIDPSGKYIVGTNNKRIYMYSDGSLSKNASKDAVHIISAMKMTNTGTIQVNKMLNARYPITLELDRYHPNKSGECETTIRNERTYIDGKRQVKRSIFKVIIKIFVESIKEDGNLSKYTMEEAIGLVGVHESEHGTNKNANGMFVDTETAEATANAKMEQAKKELIDKKKKEEDEEKRRYKEDVEKEKNAGL